MEETTTNYNKNPHTFDTLPSCLIENIFSYLSYQELTLVYVINRHLCQLAGRYIKKSVDKLRRSICTFINRISDELNINYANSDSRIAFKVYSVLKSMLDSLDMVVALNRHLVDSEKPSVTIGSVLDRYFGILRDLKSNNLRSDQLNTIQLNLQNSIVYLMWTLDKNSGKLRDFVRLGIRVVDLLDLVEDISYKVVVTYHIKNNICNITLKYHLDNPKILTYIPVIPYVKDCQRRKLTVEEQEAVMKYLVMLVCVHNKLEAKTEQYRRELEISRRDCMLNKELMTIRPPLYKHIPLSKARSYEKRHVLDANNGKIMELYSNCNDIYDENHGLNCSINLICQLSDAPLCVKESFKKLKEDIEMEDNSVKSVPTDIFEEVSSTNEIYSFNFRLRVCIPSKTPEIFEINFLDGAR